MHLIQKINPEDSMQFAKYKAINTASLEKLDSSLFVMNRKTLNDTINSPEAALFQF
jgi:hypothetical protein